MQISRDDLLGLIGWEGPTDLSLELVSDTLVDTTRWSLIHEVIFKKDDKFFKTSYSIGATESQYESPWEYGDGEVVEVTPVEVTTTEYREVPVD